MSARVAVACPVGLPRHRSPYAVVVRKFGSTDKSSWPTPEEVAKLREPPRRRIETASLRQAPDFIIIGTQRGGTTSLHRYLGEHPAIGSSWRKEVHYFDRYYDRGRDWYLAHFPKRGKFGAVGEASPFYMFDPRVPGRIAETLGTGVRFIALLRNPVDRAYSMYQMKVRRGREELSFEEAIDSEEERLGSEVDPISLPWRHYSYLRRGHYADQLERWFAHFPREAFCVIRSEDLYERPEEQLHATQAFLGVETHTPEVLEGHNQRPYSAAMGAATRRRLEAYFAPHNRRLYRLLGRDFGWEAGERSREG
jgi:Sulfotransferase domain